MALSRVGTSTPQYGAGALTVNVPAHQAGDLIVLVCMVKPSTQTMNDPTGFTRQVDRAGGTGTTGADTGPMRVRIFTNVDEDNSISTVSVTSTAGLNVWGWMAIVWRSATGAYDLAATSGDDTTTGSPFTATMDANPGMITSDQIIVAGAIPTDVSTPTQFSAETLTATGSTHTLLGEEAEFDTNLGNDLGGVVCWFNTSGTATSAPTFSATAGGTTTNVAGPIALLRIREQAATSISLTPVTETDAAQPLSASLGPAIQKTLTEALETDTAQILSFSVGGGDILMSITPATEADVAQTLSFTQAALQKTLTEVLETDTALARGFSKAAIQKFLTQADETNAAQILAYTQAAIQQSLTAAAESDMAIGLTTTQQAIQAAITQANETNTAQVLTYFVNNSDIQMFITPATETDAAQALSNTIAAIQRSLTTAIETGTAMPLSSAVNPPITVTVTPASEADQAQGVSFSSAAISFTIQPALTAEQAVALSYYVEGAVQQFTRSVKFTFGKRGYY